MAVVGYGGLAFAQGAVAITLVFALASAAYTPIMPLADAYALRGLGRLGRAYGPVRLWGSAAFIAGSLGAGVLLDTIAARDLIWLLLAGMLVTAAAALALAPLAPHAASMRAGTPSSARALLRAPAFLAASAAAGLVQASHAVYYGFSALAWQAAGLDGAAIGALWSLAVVAEIVLFAISARLPLAPTTLLPVLQCLHALSFGATHLGALGCVARAAPAEFGATAQGYLAVALGLVMAAAMGVSGLLYAYSGGLAYGAMAVAAAAGGLFALVAHRLAQGAGRAS
jgi:PPP family 3-phenylpropionic acid transporter